MVVPVEVDAALEAVSVVALIVPDFDPATVNFTSMFGGLGGDYEAKGQCEGCAAE
jgi:hypothetical protein